MLYPPIEPFASGMLALDGLHTMYWEQCGQPQGYPLLYLHGGPGDGCVPACRQLFDPPSTARSCSTSAAAATPRRAASCATTAPPIWWRT